MSQRKMEDILAALRSRKDILIEPVTEMPYWRVDLPSMAMGSIAQYERIPDFTPPAMWRGFRANDDKWDPVFLARFGKEYERNKDDVPDQPVPIWAACYMMGKSYARKNGSKLRLGRLGVYFWANWHYIEPCWMVVDNHDRLWLKTEEQLGLTH